MLSSTLLSNLKNETQLLTTSELCSLATSSYILRHKVRLSLDAVDNRSDSSSNAEVYDHLILSLDDMHSSIAAYVTSEKKDVSFIRFLCVKKSGGNISIMRRFDKSFLYVVTCSCFYVLVQSSIAYC